MRRNCGEDSSKWLRDPRGIDRDKEYCSRCYNYCRRNKVFPLRRTRKKGVMKGPCSNCGEDSSKWSCDPRGGDMDKEYCSSCTAYCRRNNVFPTQVAPEDDELMLQELRVHTQVAPEDDELMLQELRVHTQVAPEDDELMLQELRVPLRVHNDVETVNPVVPGAWVGPAPKISTPHTESGKFRTRLNPFANNVAFGAGANLDERVRQLEVTAQELAVAPGTKSETKIVESHWEVFCEMRGKEPWSPIPSGRELRCFVQALADARRADGETLYNYTTLKKRLVLLRGCIQKRNRNAWAARDAETCHDMEHATDAYLQGLLTTHVGLNRRVPCLPIGMEENRLLVKTALTFTPNMYITVRMLSLRGALLQALLHTSGVRPSSAGVATGYGYRQDPNFPSVADMMTCADEEDDKDVEGNTKAPIGGLRCGNVMLRLMELPASDNEEAKVASPGKDVSCPRVRVRVHYTYQKLTGSLFFIVLQGRFDLGRVYIGGDVDFTFFKDHSILDESYFGKFGLGWELEQATSVGALFFVFFAARGLFVLPWDEALATGRFHLKADAMNLPVFPTFKTNDVVGIAPASSHSLGMSFRRLVSRTRLNPMGITLKSNRKGFARITRLRESYEATQRLLCHAQGSNATATYLGSNNTDVNTANMWTSVGPIFTTADHNSAMVFDEPAPRPGREHMAAIYAEDEVLLAEDISKADRQKRYAQLRDRETKRMALEHEIAQTRARLESAARPVQAEELNTETLDTFVENVMSGLAGHVVSLTCHCGHVSKDRKAAQAHNRTVHKVFQRGTAEASVETAKCPTCGKVFGRNLARHLKTHEAKNEPKKTRARTHICACGFGCFTAGDLARHEKSCTGQMTAKQRKSMQEAE
ncbi:hypothetical protein HDU87_007786 [Geranomyces variabilis]|uniref:Uncharacterized protein n=1 Tax=Geranomyces variabilis TaxID=109894 RepID=A0AAD5TDN3_9FUNG|nr:hypothetical protein HDU87_007786 [Geranomyces variabilis]